MKDKSICNKGHVLTLENLYIEKRIDGKNYKHCKICRKNSSVKFKKNYPQYFIEKNKQFRQTDGYILNAKRARAAYREQWITYFEAKYGKNPKCQICDRQLFWIHENHGYRVCLDHRHGDEAIIAKSPRTWIQNKPCNAKNIKIFESCDFGILCNNCNAMLPTRNRQQYINKLIEYLQECRA